MLCMLAMYEHLCDPDESLFDVDGLRLTVDDGHCHDGVSNGGSSENADGILNGVCYAATAFLWSAFK